MSVAAKFPPSSDGLSRSYRLSYVGPTFLIYSRELVDGGGFEPP